MEQYSRSETAVVAILSALLDRGMPVDVAVPGTGQTILHMACRRMCSPIVSLLLEYDASVDRSDLKGWAAIHHAAAFARAKVVRILLAAGASVDIYTFDSSTPLHLAAASSFDSRDCIALLQNMGAERDSLMTTLDTPLHVFCKMETRDCTANGRCLLSFTIFSMNRVRIVSIYNSF